MNTNPIEFYNPLEIALDGARLQDFVDEVLASYNALQVDGFRFNDDLLPDFTYEQVQRELQMDVMASYVDLDSPAIPVGYEGATLATGKIPRMKAVEYYNEDKLRKLRLMEDRRSIERSEIVARAGVSLGEIFLRLVGRHTNSLTYQRHQVVSTAGLTLTDANNPNGIKNVTFAAHVPSANKTTLTSTKRWWTDNTYAAEGSAADPIADLQNMVKVARRKGVSRFHFEVNYNYLDEILGHSKVIAAIATNLYPLAADATVAAAAIANLGRDRKVSVLSEIVGAPIVAWDTQSAVEKWDNTNKKLTRSTFDSFAADVVVLVPDGNIGEILTVEPILLEGGEYAYYYGRKLAITIGKDFVKKCLSYNSEMTSLVVPDKPQLMFYLFPNNANA